MGELNISDLISLFGLIIVNGISLAGVFTKLNIRISENSKDILAIRSDMEEHKTINRSELNDFRLSMSAERLENKSELDKISIAISNVISSISDLRVDIAKLTMRNEYNDKSLNKK